MIEPEKRCKNCSHHLLLSQKFCHNCGQSTDTHRINFHFLVHEIQHGIFHVDGGILFTLKELFTRPGHTLREYLAGQRKSHFPPLLLVVILGSLCALLQYWIIGKKLSAPVKTSVLATDGNQVDNYVDFQGLVEYFTLIFDWLSNHFAFSVLLVIPAAALAFFLGFRKYGLNYPEWLVISLFLAGQSLAVYLLFILVNPLTGNLDSLFYLICWVLITFSLVQLFSNRGRTYVILRSIWSIFLTYLIAGTYFTIAILLAAFIGVLLYGYDNIIPEIMRRI